MNQTNLPHDSTLDADQHLESNANIVPPGLANEDHGLPVTLNDGLVPLTEDGRYVPNHLDSSGTVHWFSVVHATEGTNPDGQPYQLRYFRALQDSAGDILSDSYPVMPLMYGDRSPTPLPNLQLLLEDGELAEAQTLASDTAKRTGLPSTDLTDLRPLGELASEIGDPGAPVEQFRREFKQSAYHLLEPIDPVVNYSFEVMAVDPWTEELTASKWWLGEKGQVEHEGVTLATYSVDWPEFEKDLEHEHALIDRDTLHRTHQEEGLEAAMQRAEGIGLIYGELDPNRADGRLFHDGPTDRFTTRREAELSISSVQPEQATAVAPLAESQVPPEPGSWDELFQLPDLNEPPIDHHYWQLWVRPVETPEGTALGHALFCTEFPELPPNFDEYLDEFGMDDSIYPSYARTVEIADFRTEAEAKNFSDEFRQHLIPNLLDGPELAPDVAKLEGLPGKWAAINYDDIVRYMSDHDAVIREQSDWHVHRPYSELDAEWFPEMDEMNGTSSPEVDGRESIDTSIPPLEL